MKFCPKCGTQLPDEAKFCPNCGAKQPGMEVEQAPAPAPTTNQSPVVNSNPANTPAAQAAPVANDAEEYRRLMDEDPKFRAMMKASTMKYFSGLSNILLAIVVLLFIFTNYITFTGVDITDGEYQLMAAGAYSFPFSVNRLTSATLYAVTDKMGKAFSPNEGLDTSIYANTYVVLIAGLILPALSILGSLLGALRKGYRLETYKKDNGATLLKEIKSQQQWIIGVLFSIALMAMSIIQYIGWNDLEYKDGHRYFYGQIAADKTNMIATIVGGIIVIIIILGVCIPMHVIALKTVKPHLEENK